MESSLELPRKIWVVDDSPTDAERVRRTLAKDYEVEVMSDGAIALERLSSGIYPDLLLLDWIMPEISGLEVCQYVRKASGQLAQIPVILLTANQNSADIVQAFRSGANDYVSKPFIEEELRARVNSLMGSKRLLERAEKAEADLRILLATAPDPILVVDAQGLITFVNNEGIQAIGLPRDAIVGRLFSDLVPGMSLGHITIGNGESLLPLPDVTIGNKVYSPSLRILPSDNAAMTTVALRDVTSRRQTDARRLDFYSIIAHDLRTPITAVLLRFQMAFRGKHGLLPPSLLNDLNRAEVNLKSLLGLINDFLELARLEGVGYKIARAPVDVGDLFRSTLEDFEPLIDKNSLIWNSVGFDKKSEVLGDSQRLAQVLSNLIGNAIKFTAPGGTITSSVVLANDQIEVSIEDTGRGIAEEEIPGLFERFTRAGDTNTPGTGLGLMIVREIIEAHGGLIGVESKLGVGSRFWFRLPRYRESV